MRIAHLSDAHLLEPASLRRKAVEHLRLAYLSALRPLGAAQRVARFAKALARARDRGFDHLVLSGDLTEYGAPGQFEELARLLADSRIAPDKVTMVPGNHDAYGAPDAWQRALEGPLRPWAATSARHAGQVIDLGPVALLPVSTAVHQHWASSFGQLDAGTIDALERRAADAALGRRAVVVVQHHAPHPHRSPALQWIDGLRDHARLLALLARRTTWHVLHGHLHRAMDRVLGGGATRAFGAAAIVESGSPEPRVYELRAGVPAPV